MFLLWVRIRRIVEGGIAVMLGFERRMGEGGIVDPLILWVEGGAVIVVEVHDPA